ncbi:hypothetical protein ABZS77_13400 [Micromonospora sp. NPDC005298]|uniref:hypothetical protein n=1 Tax=Micromonospora sp. NPDC005298 TaxID=3156873 RepID=UPI0033A70BB7
MRRRSFVMTSMATGIGWKIPLREPTPSQPAGPAPATVAPESASTSGAFGRAGVFVRRAEIRHPNADTQRQAAQPMPRLHGIRLTDNRSAGYVRSVLDFALPGPPAAVPAALASLRFYTVVADPDPQLRRSIVDAPHTVHLEIGRSDTILPQRPVPQRDRLVLHTALWHAEGMCFVQFGLARPANFRVTEKGDQLLVDFQV